MAFDGVLLQEFDFYVKPRKILSGTLKMDQSNYQPGDTVNFSVSLDSSCEKCHVPNNYSLILAAVDSSVFLEVNEANTSPSLVTKVFLEKEVYNPGGEFLFWNQYVDSLYQSEQKDKDCEIKLDLLLGNQKARRNLFGPESKLQNNQEVQDEKLQKFYSYFGNQYGFNVMPMYDRVMFKKNIRPMAMAMNEAPLRAVPVKMAGAAPPQ